MLCVSTSTTHGKCVDDTWRGSVGYYDLLPYRDHVEWDEDHVREAERLVVANSSHTLPADKSGIKIVWGGREQ